ncbi:MAG TPA: hypothetical protein VGQ62_04200, partial [Chloroflexota bacterium]|nr:hypothetical protein [Chloroflexota bacterium]
MRRPRCVVAWGAVLLALCVGLAGCSAPKPQTLQGKIAWPKDGDLWVFDLASRQQTKITNLPQGAAVTGATWSPDGQRVVFSQFWRRPGERSSGADLMLANADGSNAHPFAERDAANTVLDTPTWAASGHVYYTVRRVTSGREMQSIVRQLEGGQPEMLVDNAYSPTVSPDEGTLVYLRNTRAGQTLFRKSFSEAGDGCELLSDQVFQYLSQPRISPDGKQVALGGSGEATMQPSGCGGDPRTKPTAAGFSGGPAGGSGGVGSGGTAGSNSSVTSAGGSGGTAIGTSGSGSDAVVGGGVAGGGSVGA